MNTFGKVVTVVIVVGAGYVAWHHFFASQEKAKPQTPAVPVTAGTVTPKDVPIFIRTLGTVQANYTVTIRPQIDGPITAVFFQQGQMVKTGDKLFEIDPRPYQAALEFAQGTEEKDEAQLKGAEVTLARYAKLVGPGYQTRQAYDDQKAMVAQLQGTVKADQANILSAQINLEHTMIRAPIDGKTGARLVDPGNFVQASSTTGLVTITQISPCFVNLTAPQDQLDEIRANEAKGALDVQAYASDDKTLLSSGKLSLIDNQIDTTTGTIQIKGSFDNTDQKLWPGEFVSAHLILSVQKGALTVPAATVMEGPNGYFAFIINQDNTASQVNVEVETIQDGLAIITKGLSAGQKIVVDGQYRLTKGAKVKINQPPAASPQNPSPQKPPRKP